MFSKTRNRMTEEHYEKEIGRLRTALEEADAVVIGAGAGQGLFCADNECRSLFPEGRI